MTTSVICSRCKNKTSVNNVRYGQNGKDLICLQCFNAFPKELPKQAVRRENYQCMRCNYKFSFKKGSRIERTCPYCASYNVSLRDSVNARSVLSDVTANPEFAFPR